MLEIEVSTDIAAPGALVWDLIGDPTRMGEWSPECERVAWVKGTAGPAAGARFRGHNRNGWRRWSTTGTIVDFEPGARVSWDVTLGPLPVARWEYRIDDRGDGCTVIERFVDHRGRLVTALGTIGRGVTDVEGHNRRGMLETLERVKSAAEHHHSRP